MVNVKNELYWQCLYKSIKMVGRAAEVILFSQLSDNVTMHTELLLNIENDQ